MRLRINSRFLLQLTIVITILSQISSISSIFRPLMFVMWVVDFIYGIIHRKGRLRITLHTRIFVVCYFLFFFFCMVCSAIPGNQHLSGSYLNVMLIPLLVSITLNAYVDDLQYNDIVAICKTYVIVAIIYGLYVHITYFPSYSRWLQQIRYAFLSKNSAALIWGVGFFLALFMPRISNEKKGWIWYFVAAYFLLISALSQCRTSLLGIALGLIVYIITNAKYKTRWIILVIVTVAVSLFNPTIRRFFDNVFMISRNAGADANAFSSGRINIYRVALDSVKNHLVIGVGSYYVDCSYIMVLAETGIIGFVLIEVIWVSRLVLNLKWKNMGNTCGVWKSVIVVTTVLFIVESILEGLPPFGPGVSCFMFWLLCSITVDNPFFRKQIVEGVDERSNKRGLIYN